MSRLIDMIGDGRRLMIGMVQLPPLPSSARFRLEAAEDILGRATDEAQLLSKSGIDALMVQNLGDIPVAGRASHAQVAWMTRAMVQVAEVASCPVGLNMLENDVEAMFAVASATEADFVRIKIFVGAMVTPFGVEEGRCHEAIRARTSLGADGVAILADVHDRTGTPLATSGFKEDLDFALRLGGADAVVLTGKSHDETIQMAATARAGHPDAPILLGGGVSAENLARSMTHASGAIVSSSMKDGGRATGRFLPERVTEMMAAARDLKAEPHGPRNVT